MAKAPGRARRKVARFGAASGGFDNATAAHKGCPAYSGKPRSAPNDESSRNRMRASKRLTEMRRVVWQAGDIPLSDSVKARRFQVC